MVVRVSSIINPPPPLKKAAPKRGRAKKKRQPLFKSMLKWPLKHWRTSLILFLFLLGGFISNLDRAANYVRNLRGLRRFMPTVVADLIFPPEYLDFGMAQVGQELFGTVEQVTDGDTFLFRSVGGNEEAFRVRMWGIDAPESSQTFGRDSAEALSTKILGRAVRLQVAATDRYSRQVCRVYGDNEEDINLYMVKSGYAWYYPDSAPDARFLEDAEAEAIKNKRGLWTYPAPKPPWEFRSEKRSGEK